MSDRIGRSTVTYHYGRRGKAAAVFALLFGLCVGNIQAVPEVIVDDDWAGTTSGTEVLPAFFYGTNAFARVTSGVEAVDAGGTVTVKTGLYPELVVLSKPMTLRAGSKPVLQAPVGSPAGQALVTVNANNVTINGFEFRIDQTSATHGIRAANPDLFDNLTVTDNEFVGTGPYVFGTAAIQLLGGSAPPYENVSVRGNVVTATTVTNGLSRGVFVRDVVLQAGGPNPADGNQISAIVQDILVQNARGSTTLLGNVFQGAGVDLTSPRPGSNVAVTSNSFAPLVPFFSQSLLVKNNTGTGVVTAQNNQFIGHSVGVLVGGSQNVTVADNTFTPGTGVDYKHIVVDSRYPGAAPVTTVPTDATILRNTFNPGDSGVGTALKFQNFANGEVSPEFDQIIIGGVGDENEFKAGIRRYIALDGTSGFEFDYNLTAADNLFGVSGGDKLPADMTTAERFELEDLTDHKVDYAVLGRVDYGLGNNIYITGNSFLAPYTNFAALQRAVNLVSPGGTVWAGDGVYFGTTLVNKAGVTVRSGSNPILEAAPGSPAGQTLLTVSAPNVTVQGLTFHVDQTSAVVGLGASAPDNFDNLVAANNTFVATGPFNFNAAGIQVFGSSSGPVRTITLTGNQVLASLPAGILSRGFRLRFVRALIGSTNPADANDITALVQDVLLQFGRGTSEIRGNLFQGAGVDITSPSGGGSVVIDGNNFVPLTNLLPQSLLVKDNTGTGNVTVTNNTFTSHSIGLLVGGSRNVAVSGNVFTPPPGAGYTHIVVDSRWPGAAPVTTIPTAVDIQNNVFNPGDLGVGTAIKFQNFAKGEVTPEFGPITIGNVTPNTFNSGIRRYISLDGSPGFEFDKNLDATNNLFGVSSGVKLPSAMTTAELFELEDLIDHKVDFGAIGEVTFNGNNAYVTANSFLPPLTTVAQIQRGINVIEQNGTCWVSDGVFPGLVTITTQGVTLRAGSTPILVAPPGSPAGSALVTVAADNVTILGLTFHVDQTSATFGIRAANPAPFNNLTVSGNTFRGTGPFVFGSAGVEAFGNGGIIETVTLTDNTVDFLNDIAHTLSRGFRLREVRGTVGGPGAGDGNTIFAAVQDVLVQFTGGTGMLVQGNDFLGGGVDFTEPSNGTVVTVRDNNFTPLASVFPHSLLIKHNYTATAQVAVFDNYFGGHAVGVWTGGSRNVDIFNNIFVPDLTADFTHIIVDTNYPSSTQPPYVPNSATIRGNIFNGGAPGLGRGVQFRNGLKGLASPDFSGIVLGGAGSDANQFLAPMNQYIALDETVGLEFDLNLNGQQNLYQVASGLKPPSAMTLDELYELEDKVFHATDDGDVGFVLQVPQNSYVTQLSGSVQRGINVAANGWTVNVNDGLFNEPVNVNRSVRIRGKQRGVDARGRSGLESVITSTDPNFHVRVSADNVTLDGLSITTGVRGVVVTKALGTGYDFRNLVLAGMSRDGIHLFNAAQGVVERCFFSNINGTGLNAGNDLGTPSFADDRVTSGIVRYNEFANCQIGISGYWRDSVLTKNLVRDRGTSFAQGIEGQFLESVITDNIVRGYSQGSGITIQSYSNRPDCTSVTIEHNALQGNAAGYLFLQEYAGSGVEAQFNHFGPAGVVAGANAGSSSTVEALLNWWGDPTGPVVVTGLPGAPNGVSPNFAYDPWIGKDTPLVTDYAVLTDDSAVSLAASDGASTSGLDVFPGTGLGAGRTFTIGLEAGAPDQGVFGLPSGGAINGTLHVTTDQTDGRFIAVVKVAYSDADLIAAGITDETQVVVYNWDPVLRGWVLAVTGNTTGTPTWVGDSPPIPIPGFYGVDTANNIAWATVDHSSEYAASADVTLAPSPDNADLEISKTDLVDPVFVGDMVTYNITVTNNGPDDATSVTVADIIPAGLSFHYASAPFYTFGVVVYFDLGTLADGETTMILVDCFATSAGVVVNNASVGSQTGDSVDGNNVAEEDTTILGIPQADLRVSKQDSVDPVLVGQDFDYIIEVFNDGPDQATSVSLVDAVPADLAINGVTVSQGSFTVNGSTVTAELGTLPVGTTATIIINVTALAAGSVSNTIVDCFADEQDPDPSNNTPTAETEILPVADLSIAKVDTSDPVLVGVSFDYVIGVFNAGPSDATSVTVEDAIPAGLNILGVVASQGTASVSGSTVTADLGALPVGNSATVTITVAGTVPGTVTNEATVTGGEFDPNAGDNLASETTVIRPATADLVVSKADSADPVLVGEPFDYVITVSNNGPEDTWGVTVTDAVPAGLTIIDVIVSQGSASVDGSTVTAWLGTIGAGESATVTITVVADSDGLVTNVASAVADEFDPDEANNVDSEDTTIIPVADVSVTKNDSADPVVVGSVFAYSIEVTNNGPSAADDVQATDTLPAGVGVVSVVASTGTATFSGGIVSASLGTLDAGATATVVITVVPSSVGLITNTVIAASSTVDTVPSNNTAAETTLIVPPTPAQADLRVSKTDLADPVDVGSTFTYTITVVNGGPDASTSVSVVDVLPAGLGFVSASTSSGTVSHAGGIVTATVGDLPAGGTVTVDIVVQALSSGPVINSAFAAGTVSDPNPVNNVASEQTVLNPAADLSITKTDSADPVQCSSPLSYTIVVTNAGPDIATSVTMVDSLPGDVIYQSASASQGSVSHVGPNVVADLGALAPGGSATVTVNVLTSHVLATVSNVATVFANENDPNPADNSAVENTTIVAFLVYKDDDFSTGALVPPGSMTGWSPFGFDVPGFASPSYDPLNGAYLGTVAPDPTKFRVTGVVSNPSEWMPYAFIGPNQIVRVKYYMYRTGQSDPANYNLIPALRMRASNRFAVNSMLEVFPNLAADPANTALYHDLRPSDLPSSPSLYRVDFDVVDVPYLVTNAATEGVLRAFDAYAVEPQHEGSIAMAESVIGSYPLACVAPTLVAPVRVLEPTTSTAGTLGVVNPSELTLLNFVVGAGLGEFPTIETSGSLPTYSEGPFGISLDATAVPSDRVGFASREFNPDGGPVVDFANRVRISEGKQYVVRWHLTSTQLVSKQSQIRLRARSARFAYGQKFEIGGAWASGNVLQLNANNTIAQQALPGIGTLNPDKNPGDTTGGWYTLIMASPLSKDIRSDFPAGTPLSVSMPVLGNQPGPGVNAPSSRDFFVGLDLVDTISGGQSRALEQGHVTLDRVEIREYNLIPD